jgi:hypothetical protein
MLKPSCRMQALQIFSFLAGAFASVSHSGSFDALKAHERLLMLAEHLMVFLVLSGFFHHSICVACCESKGASSSYYPTLHLLKLDIFITLEACSLFVN